MEAFFAANSTNVLLAIVAVFNALAAWFAWQAKKVAQITHLSVNSRLDELVEATRLNALREGADKERKIGEAKATALAARARK